MERRPRGAGIRRYRQYHFVYRVLDRGGPVPFSESAPQFGERLCALDQLLGILLVCTGGPVCGVAVFSEFCRGTRLVCDHCMGRTANARSLHLVELRIENEINALVELSIGFRDRLVGTAGEDGSVYLALSGPRIGSSRLGCGVLATGFDWHVVRVCHILNSEVSKECEAGGCEMRRHVAIAIALVTLGGCDGADNECNGADTARKMAGCTAAIDRPGISQSDLAVAFSRRSDAFLAMGDLRAAIADRTRALELEPRNERQKQRLSELYRIRADIATDDEKKIASYNEALRIDPSNHVAFFGRAAIHLQKSSLDAAVADLVKARELQPSENVYRTLLVKAHQLRGLAHVTKGDLGKGIGEYTSALNLEADSAGLYTYRGDAYMSRKEFGKALEDYSKAIDLAPNSNDVLLRRGHLHMAENRLELAIEDFGKVIQRDPTNVRALMLRGLAREQNGFLGHARTDYEMILQIDPKNSVAAEGLKRIAAFQGKSAGEPPREAPSSLERLDGEVIKAVQEELERVGCDPGEIDGVWGENLKDAVKEFAKHAKVSLPSEEASQDLLTAISQHRERVCPLECKDGREIRDGRCVSLKGPSDVGKGCTNHETSCSAAKRYCLRNCSERAAGPRCTNDCHRAFPLCMTTGEWATHYCNRTGLARQ